MTVPLRHFMVGICFLGAGAVVGIGSASGFHPGLAELAHVHLLLAGWLCLTIMGAMTQFVPVWSGVELHSRRLASLQLALVTAGLVGFVVSLLLSELSWLPLFGMVMLAGFWTFVYNVGRTLLVVERYDVTERHFALALGFFLALTVLGVLLATDLTRPLFAGTPLTHQGVLQAHATVAVFGAVLTTVYGALYQLGTMFTQTELDGFDESLQTLGEIGHPLGVGLLAGGRLFDVTALARPGGLLVVFAALSFGVVLGRKLYEMRVEWAPMHTRYTVVVPMLLAWAVATAPAWLSAPTDYTHLLGAAGTAHLLVVGAIGFVVFGTLYHVIPFIIWVHRYSDLLGLEEVPMIDDLYDDRLAAADAVCLLVGTILLVVVDIAALSSAFLSIAGILIATGIVIFSLNMALVVRRHSPYTIDHVLLGSFSPRQSRTPEERSSRDL